jgi:hypothetical protein
LGIRAILNVHSLGSFFKFESQWFFDSERFTEALCVTNKIMRIGGSLRGFEVTKIGDYLILDYFPQKDTTSGLFLKCSHNPNWWLLMKSNYLPGQNQTFHVNQRVFEVFEITKTSGSLILIFFKIKSSRFSDSIIFKEPESVVVNEI